MNNLTTEFFDALLKGDKAKSNALALSYFEQKGGELKPVYEEMIKEALYEVGRYWEFNKITVATEHLASAISEAVLNQLFAKVSLSPPHARSAVFACIENEEHEIGIKMVNDMFELHQWNCYYLGANTPLSELLSFVEAVKPEVLSLSLSIYFNYAKLKETLSAVLECFPDLQILVGGQAFDHTDGADLEQYENVKLIRDLDTLENYLLQYE